MANFRIEAALYLTLTLLVCHVVAKSLQKRDDSSRYEEKGVAGVNKQDITTAKVAPNSVENIGSQTQPPLGSNVNQSANVGDKAELADTSKVDPGTARLPGIYKVGGDMSDSQTDLKHVPNDNQSGILVQPSSGYSIPVNGTVQSESQILQGPPESGSYKGNLPAEGRNAQGPPESGYYQGNLPAEGRNAQGPPESGSYKGNLPAEGRNAQGPPESGYYQGNPPAEGRIAQGPPESGSYKGNLPAEGRNAQGPPESGSYQGNPPAEGRIAQGPPESGYYKGNPPAEGRIPQGPPESGSYKGNLPTEGQTPQSPGGIQEHKYSIGDASKSGNVYSTVKGNPPISPIGDSQSPPTPNRNHGAGYSAGYPGGSPTQYPRGRIGISSDKQNTSTRGSDAPTGTVNRGNIQPVTDAREVLVQGAGSGQGGASSINTVKPVNPQDLPVKQEDLLMVLSTTTSALPDWQNSQPFPNNANPDDNAIEPEDDIDDIDDIDEMDDDEEDEAQYGDDDDDDDEDLQNSYDYNRQNAPSNINQQRINLPLNNNPNQKVNVEPDPVIESSGHFMAYFIVLMIAVVAGYLVYHNRQKVLAFIIEGRNGRKNPRRPSSSEYKKLASNVDEAVMSLGEKTSPQNIIY